MQFTLALAVFGASVALALPIAQLPSLPGGGLPQLPGGTGAVTSLLSSGAGAGALPGIPRGLPSLPGGAGGATSLLSSVTGGVPTTGLPGIPRGLSTGSLTPGVEGLVSGGSKSASSSLSGSGGSPPLIDAGSTGSSHTYTHGNQIL